MFKLTNGLWVGTVLGSGEWHIGDKLPWDHPGFFTGRSRLMCKQWRARQDDPSHRYLGEGHAAELPAHGGRDELVQVGAGHFLCLTNNAQGSADMEVGSYKLHGPADERCWVLPDPASETIGSTLCFDRQVELTVQEDILLEAAHPDFVYRFLSSQTNRQQNQKTPPGLWRYQLVMVFQGKIKMRVPELTGQEEHFLKNGDYCFINQACADRCLWQPLDNTVAAVLWY